ncbi:PH domain-containing protein [Streptomyces sp. MP131-18]|uniref:PH domain-containing protein n=1 Tax=Streptomyces sp. MP131-18 TaxID=1857892 RepID=UPI00097C78A0|nr:PH domain-containing protein [Streptomyces sp. MP131-18]ONK11807.1 Bacterial membrane flanked domain protein [Streptomyces sp. MP131-18]
MVNREVLLRPPRHRVERRAILLWAARALGVVLPLAGALAVAHALWDAVRPWTGPGLLALAVAGPVYATGMPLWRYAVHRWETTDDAVYAAAGWFVREWRIAPVSRIQTVDTVRGPFEQLLGLSTLTVTTASSSGAIRISGLDPQQATRAAERLSEITGRTPGDAT